MRAIPSASGRAFRSGRRAGRQGIAGQENPRLSRRGRRGHVTVPDRHGAAMVTVAVRADRMVVGIRRQIATVVGD